MTSFFSFSSNTSSAKAKLASPKPDDTQLDITVTPASAAFYAGETFSVTITFSCSRKNTTSRPVSAPHTPINTHGDHNDNLRTPTSAVRSASDLLIPNTPGETSDGLPRRKKQIGLAIDTPPEAYGANAEAGPSRYATPLAVGGYADSPGAYGASPYSPGADPSRGGWPKYGSPNRDALAGVRSPEEVRRYGGSRAGERRTQSLALGKGMSPQEMVWALGGHSTPPLPTRRPPGAAPIPTSHPHSRKISVTSQPQAKSPATSSIDLSDSHLQSIPESASYTGDSSTRSRPHLSRNPSSSSISSSASHPLVEPIEDTPRYRPNRHLLPAPSTLSPPPSHPYIRSLAEPRETTILWAHTRLVAHFHPSNAYIPPDPLLPLRSLLLHQPIGAGSGSLTSSSSTGPATGGSRWQLSFGTGTIGHETKPSLTGSLVGLASSLVYGGSAGTLEEDRKKAWNTKDLPVMETARSLLGVDIKLKEGEKREFVYTFPIPRNLPPTYRGRAFRFGWDLVLSLAVSEGGGKGQMRNREIEVPIRVWNHVALGAQISPYDVLSPIIQTTDQGTVTELSSVVTPSTSGTAGLTKGKSGDTQSSLDAYARHLLGTLSSSSNGIMPLSPSLDAHHFARARSPSQHDLAGDVNMPSDSEGKLAVHDSTIGKRAGRGRKGSFIQGDEELVEEGGDGDGCDQAVEILSRHSTKASYDIAKDGDLVSVLTLLKTTYRLGETILGVITINPPPQPSRQVLKFSAYLESNDLIPTSLLPPSPRGGISTQPALVRTHADFAAGYVNQTGRISFNLDIPADATPGFSFGAGGDDAGDGGLEWRIRLAFLVATPARGASATMMTAKEGDNGFYTAAHSLAPVLQMGAVGDGRKEVGGDVVEMETETVECEIPIKVLPGNAAFKVKSTVYAL